MVADSIEELHEFAEKLGIARKHFQDHRKPHYDISKAYKQRALALGAEEIDDRYLIYVLRGTYEDYIKQSIDKFFKEHGQKIKEGFNKMWDRQFLYDCWPVFKQQNEK